MSLGVSTLAAPQNTDANGDSEPNKFRYLVSKSNNSKTTKITKVVSKSNKSKNTKIKKVVNGSQDDTDSSRLLKAKKSSKNSSKIPESVDNDDPWDTVRILHNVSNSKGSTSKNSSKLPKSRSNDDPWYSNSSVTRILHGVSNSKGSHNKNSSKVPKLKNKGNSSNERRTLRKLKPKTWEYDGYFEESHVEYNQSPVPETIEVEETHVEYNKSPLPDNIEVDETHGAKIGKKKGRKKNNKGSVDESNDTRILLHKDKSSKMPKMTSKKFKKSSNDDNDTRILLHKDKSSKMPKMTSKKFKKSSSS